MKASFRQYALLILWLVPSVGLPATARRLTRLTGWDPGRNPDEDAAAAADCGFTHLIVTWHSAKGLTHWAEACREHGLGLYACLTLTPGKWKQHYPDAPPPLQDMTAEQEEAAERLSDPEVQRATGYQSGGEPLPANRGREVLLYEMLCFHDARVGQMLKKMIDEILAVEGVSGVAFDCVGYRNYRFCHCATSERLFREYRAQHPGENDRALRERFALETLVDFNNDLARYVRSARPGAEVTNHIWPCFEPEPLYGNRLDVDFCGQTAAWFYNPDLDEVSRYAGAIVQEESAFFPDARGVAMMGYYNRPDSVFPVKTPERVEAELRAILRAGCTRVQVCSLRDVLATPAVAEVFRRYAPPKQDGGRSRRQRQ